MNSSHDLSSCVIPTLNCPFFQISKPTVENDVESQKLGEWLPHPQDPEGDDQESIRPVTRSTSDDNPLLSESSAQPSGKIIAFYCNCW